MISPSLHGKAKITTQAIRLKFMLLHTTLECLFIVSQGPTQHWTNNMNSENMCQIIISEVK